MLNIDTRLIIFSTYRAYRNESWGGITTTRQATNSFFHELSVEKFVSKMDLNPEHARSERHEIETRVAVSTVPVRPQ